MDKQTKVFAAQVLGTMAFKAGKPCIPALDKDVQALLAGNKVGESIPILKAWHRGWTLANLARAA